MVFTKKDYKKLIDHLDEELDKDFEDALQATEEALKSGKDVIGIEEKRKGKGKEKHSAEKAK